MYYISLPFSRQISINLFVSLLLTMVCAFIVFQGAAYKDISDKHEIVRQQVTQVSKFIENKAQQQITSLLKDIIAFPHTNIYLPPDIAYIEWHNNFDEDASYTQYVSDWPFEYSAINNFKQSSFAHKNDANLEFMCSVDCFLFVYRKYTILNHHGYAISAIKTDSFSFMTASLNDLPNLHLITNNDKADWLDAKVSKKNFANIIALNHNNITFSRLDTITKELGPNPTYRDIVNKLIETKHLGEPVFTPIKFRGLFVGYNATFAQPITFLSSIKSGIFYEFGFTLLATVMLIILLCYHLFNIIRLIKFLKRNRIRLAKYAHLTKANNTDEIFTLLQYLDKSLTSNEQRDNEIESLNHRMSLYSNYDPITSLPNVEWLKEQITHRQAEFKMDNSVNIYLIEFCPKIESNVFANGYNSRQLTNEIQTVLADDDRLATMGEGVFAILTTSCLDINSVYSLLDNIKQRIFAYSQGKSQNLYAGIVRIVSATIPPTRLLEKVQLAYNSSCNNNSSENYTLFNDSLKQISVSDSIFEVHMRKAKLSGEITTSYKVIHNLRTNRCDAIEARTEWHKDNEILALEDFTDEFIGCGINIEFGYWKIENCLSDLHLLDNKTSLHLNIIIPLNYGQLVDPNLFSFMDVTTVKYHILPSRIFFKINEDAVRSDIIGALGAIQAINHNGFNIHVENFGPNYFNTKFIISNNISSVSILSSIVKRITMTEYDRYMITENIRNALLTKSFKIIAEGIDSPVLVKIVESIGVEFVTGNLYPENSSVNELIKYLNNN